MPKESRIIDFTQNVIMSKQNYIKITNFKELSKISKEDVISDRSKVALFNMKIAYYLFFRDEIMKDINKNEKVFELKK